MRGQGYEAKAASMCHAMLFHFFDIAGPHETREIGGGDNQTPESALGRLQKYSGLDPFSLWFSQREGITMSEFRQKHLLAIALLASMMIAGMVSAATINVPADYATIEAALAAAAPGDDIQIADGTYNLTGTLTINQALTLNGQSEGGVTINIPAAGGYGISVNASNVILSNFTLAANATNNNYPIHASGTTNPPNGWDYLTIQHVTIQGAHQRTGFDVHGYNHVVLSYLTSSDATGGNGVQVTGCVDVDMDHITTLNNAWGSIAIYCSSSSYLNRGSDDVYIDGDTCSLGEQNLYNQDEFGLFNTNIVVNGYEYLVRNASVVGYDWYQDTLADARIFAQAAEGTAPGNYIETIVGGTFTVPAGLTIQAAIDAADPGDAIVVEAGHFEEQLHITKNDLSLTGAGVDVTYVDAPNSMPLAFTTSAANYPVVFVDGASGVALADLTIDGLGRGNSNYRFVGCAYYDAGGSMTDVHVAHVMDTPFSGAQHGVGVYCAGDDAQPHAFAMTDVLVDDFQKTAVVLYGDGVTATLLRVTTPGQGPTTVTAQNGLQFSGGAAGSATDCTISDVDYTGENWTATGFMTYDAGTVTCDGATITGCQTSAYLIDSSGTFDNSTISDPHGDALYVYSTGAKAESAGPRLLAQPFDAPGAKTDKAAVTVTIDGSTFIGNGTADSWGPTAFGYGPVTFTMTNCEVTNWDWGVVNYDYGGATFNTNIHQCNIHGNTSYGFYTNANTTADATCNWWGNIGGPDDSPANPSSGDAVEGDVSYAPWLDGVGGNCDQYGDNNIAALDASSCLTPGNTCTTIPVVFNRLDATPSRGVSVTFQLSPELVLCTPDMNTDIVVATGTGTWADGYGNLNYQLIDNGGGSYTVDLAILGVPCGPTAGGDLFSVNVAKAASVTADAVGTLTVTDVIVRDCNNVPLPGIPGAPGYVTIDLTNPGTLTDLAAAQVKTGNDSDGTTKIALSWTAPGGDSDFIDIYRKGFGDYPEYDDGTGAEPTAPVTTANGWVLIATVPATTTSYVDEPATRDFWYYAAYVTDSCGNVSVASDITGGTLNYHLGDVHNGTAAGSGDNLVTTSDISHLGANYGITPAYGSALNYLDVGPTTDYSVDARPTTDNRVQFEDLMMFAINYGQVSKAFGHPAPVAVNNLVLDLSSDADRDGILEAAITMSGDGQVQGLSVPLVWNSAVVQPVGMEPGNLLADQGGLNLVVSPAPGTVDAALFGIRDSGISGEGLLATVRFKRVGPGEPGISLGEVTARDAENKAVMMDASSHGPDLGAVPMISVLNKNVPNPFNPSTTFSFMLARTGKVTLNVYTLRGQLVRTLVDEAMEAGPHTVNWNGADNTGRQAPSGVYLVRMVAPDRIQSRRITLVK